MKIENITYSDNLEFLVWSWTGINQISERETSEKLKYCRYDALSGYLVLDQLSRQPSNILEQSFNLVIQFIIFHIIFGYS